MADTLRFYALDTDLPAGFFGVSYAATAFSLENVSPGCARLEFLFLLTLGVPRLWRAAMEVPFGRLPGIEQEWDAPRIHEEGRGQLELKLYYAQRLRAANLGRPDLADARVKLKPMETRPLIGSALRGQWTAEIRELAITAETPVLKRYCEAAMRMGQKVIGPRGPA
ncbi:hypothetical protein [Rhizobacter fulvus]|jgi:hypothetical protein